jgi:hypothetical protein
MNIIAVLAGIVLRLRRRSGPVSIPTTYPRKDSCVLVQHKINECTLLNYAQVPFVTRAPRSCLAHLRLTGSLYHLWPLLLTVEQAQRCPARESDGVRSSDPRSFG